MKPEAKVKGKLRRRLAGIDKVLLRHNPSGGFGSYGVEDYGIFCNGQYLGVEVKSGSKPLTAHQDANVRMMGSYGVPVILLNEENFDEQIEYIKRWVSWALDQKLEVFQ